jgi:hypothetical protein
MTWEGESYRSFSRLCVRSFVCRREVKRMTMKGKKVMTRGRRSKNRGQAKKKFLWPNRGLKDWMHRHTSSGRIVFPSFNSQQIPKISERVCYYFLMIWSWLTFWMTSRLDQRRLNVAKWGGRGKIPSKSQLSTKFRISALHTNPLSVLCL